MRTAKSILKKVDQSKDKKVDDKNSMKIRSQVCNGFRTESSLMYIAQRAGIEGTEARVISLLSSSLLSMTLPDLFNKLAPIFCAIEGEAGAGDLR